MGRFLLVGLRVGWSIGCGIVRVGNTKLCYYSFLWLKSKPLAEILLWYTWFWRRINGLTFIILLKLRYHRARVDGKRESDRILYNKRQPKNQMFYLDNHESEIVGASSSI